MDFELSEEQKMFRDSVKNFMEKEYGPVVDKRDREGPLSKEECQDVMKKFKSIGLGLDPESISSLIDPVIFGIMAEEIAAVWASLLPIIGMSAIPGLFSPGTTGESHDRLMAKLTSGEFIGAFAETEPAAGCDTHGITTTAKPDGDNYIINGSKTWISNATVCDAVFIGANDTSTGMQTFFLMERDACPFDSSELHKIGWNASPTGELFFDNCVVPKENEMSELVQGALGSGTLNVPEGFLMLINTMQPATAMLTMPRVGMGLGSVGIARAAYDASVRYAKEREQFGKPIGKFQLIQRYIYEMRLGIETARLLGHRAADLIVHGNPEARLFSALTKSYGGETASKVTHMAIQVHGGMGLSTEMPLERFYRDARVMTIPDGTTEMMTLMATHAILGKGFSAYH